MGYTSCDHCSKVLYIPLDQYNSNCVAWCKGCASFDSKMLRDAGVYTSASLVDCVWWANPELVQRVRSINKIEYDGITLMEGKPVTCKKKYYGIDCECCCQEEPPYRNIFGYKR